MMDLKSPIFNPNPSLYPDPMGRAERMCNFIRRLKLWEGDRAGENVFLYPFQEAMIRRIYGPSKPDGRRLTRIANIWLPRGNGKTTLISALSLAHFLGPEAEAGGQIVAAAADRENAGLAFNCAYQMIRQDEVILDKIGRCTPSHKLMEHKKTNSTFKAISTESYTKHGLNVSFFLADELHAWPPTEARKLWKVVTDSMVKRTDPLTIVISTAGEGMGGFAREQWDYSHRVAKGEIDDPTFAPIIFAVPPEEEGSWRDEEFWKKANPGIEAGFVHIEELQTKVKRSFYFPTEAADFKRFHLNIWIDGTALPWIDLDVYDRCEKRKSKEEVRSRPCYVGVDLSSVEDLTAVVAVFPDDGEGEGGEEGQDDGVVPERGFDIFPMFFLPEEGLSRKGDRDQANYLKWEQDGHLIITEGNRIDQKVIHDYVMALSREYDVKEVAVDRWNSTAFVTGLQDEGLEVVEFGQGFVSMAGPVKQIKSSILGGKFRHGRNPILRMCFANVVTVKDDAENEKFTKSRARGRIDGATACAEAIGRILAHEAEGLNLVYRGVFSSDEKYNAAFKRKRGEPEPDAPKLQDPEDDGSWKPEVLRDINHPLFAEHKLRFERWQRRQSSRDWD